MNECNHKYTINSYEAICISCGKTKGEIIQQENTQLKSDLQALRERLKKIEYTPCGGFAICPACHEETVGNTITHDSDCWLIAELVKLNKLKEV